MKQIKLKVNHLTRNTNISYIRQYLNTLGIEKIESFINQPDEEDELDPFLLLNMRSATKVAYDMLSNGCNVFVQVDSDTDGYTSSSILINYIKRRFPQVKITWRLHKGKEHGIILDTVPADTDLVFIPEGGSNQFEEQKA